jgi:anti-anti-sigma factor
VAYDADRTAVWLRGEHDLSTTAEVTVALARAIALDDDDLVIDLSEVEFMGAETIGIIIRTRDYLRSRSRDLVLRAPSPLARRVVDLCGLAPLIAPHPTDATPMLEAAGALGSWVEVPATGRVLLPVPVVVGADVDVALALAGRASMIAPPTPNVASLPGP